MRTGIVVEIAPDRVGFMELPFEPPPAGSPG
jgi:hypothetical protein